MQNCKWCLGCFFTVATSTLELLISDMLSSCDLGGGEEVWSQHFDRLIRYCGVSDSTLGTVSFKFKECKLCLCPECFSLFPTLQWQYWCLTYCCGYGGGTLSLDSWIRYSWPSDNNTNNVILPRHYGLEWPSVDTPSALGPNCPWTAGASTEGHTRPQCPQK